MKALVLAGGFPQIALLNELRSRGIYTILADYYENPVAKPYADQFYQVSTLDIAGITDIAQKESVDFLITVCTDQALLTVAKVSEDLGLPCYIDYQTGLNVTNKQYMKKMFRQFNVPSAKYAVMDTLEWSELQDMAYPLVVKPVDCNSSKGVVQVHNDEELKIAFDKAVEYSRTNTAIIEEFIDGLELTVDVYVENGKASVLAVSNSEKIKDSEKFVIFRTKYPVISSQVIEDKVTAVAQGIADAFEIKNSPMLIQMILRDGDVYVLEFSARTGGGVKYQLIQRVCGFDVIKAVVDLTMGQFPHLETRPAENKYIVNEFIYCKPGVFDHLENFEELKQEGILSDYFLFKWRGAVFDTIANSGDRVAGFTVQADTLPEVYQKHQEAVSRLKVINTQGEDMMRHDILLDLEYHLI